MKKMVPDNQVPVTDSALMLDVKIGFLFQRLRGREWQ
jgi:hypothetical protein